MSLLDDLEAEASPEAPRATATPKASAFSLDDLEAEAKASTEEPGLLSRIGSGIVDTAKSVGRGISKGADLISPISNPGPGITDEDSLSLPGGYRLHAPFSQLAHPDYRREVERGASRAIPGNPGEKVANLFPDYAAAAPADEAANPGVSDLGALGMSAAFNPMVSASVGAAKAAAAKVANGAVDRIAARNLDRIAAGGTEKARVALGQVKGKALSMLKEKPSLAEGDTTDIAKNFADEGDRLGVEREKEFTEADRAAEARALSRAREVRAKDPSAPPLTAKEREAIQDRAKVEVEDLLRERQGLPAKDRTPAQTPSQIAREAVPEAVDEPGTVRVPREKMSDVAPKGSGGEDPSIGASRRAALPDDFHQLDKTQPITTPASDDIPIVETDPVKSGAPVSLIAKHVDKTIARLEKGTQTEREIAKAMADRRDKLLETHGPDGALSSSDLRRQISDYQNAYDKTASNVSNKADKEMSKALHGALEEHIDDPEAYARIKALTDKMSVATRAQKLLDARAGKEAAPGGGPRTPHGIVGGIARDIKHSHTTIGAAAKIAHRVATPVAQFTDKAIAGGAEGVGNAAAKPAGIVARYLQLRRAGKDDEAEAYAAENGL